MMFCTSLSDLKSSFIGQFVCVKGTVVRAAGTGPLVNRMNFSCHKCSSIIVKDLPDGKFQPPSHCEAHECKGRTFKAIKTSTCVTVDYQKVRIQEVDDGLTVDPGRVPRSVDVELTEELVDLVLPGDVITVTGVVKALNVESLSGRGSRAKGKGKESSILLLLIEANAVENKLRCFYATRTQDPLRGTQRPAQDHSTQDASQDLKSDVVANLTKSDFQMISTICTKFDFAFLVYSLCPLIYGHEHVKAGLLLALTGGTALAPCKKSSVSIRPDIHILVVGDPGLGENFHFCFSV